MAEKINIRIRSMRAYRRIGDELLHRARSGEIPWGHYTTAIRGLKAQAEIFLAESLMQAHGLPDSEPEGILGEDGGLQDLGKLAGLFVSKKLVTREGHDRDGNPVEEITKTYEGERATPEEMIKAAKRLLITADALLMAGDVSEPEEGLGVDDEDWMN